MDELDKLKDVWKSQDYSKDKVSTTDIYKMLRAKSSSYIKWIFIISVIEFSIGIAFSIFSYLSPSHKKSIDLIREFGYYTHYIFLNAILFVVLIYFSAKFYQMFKCVEVSDSAKKLMQTILDTRKIVKKYIYFNLIVGFVIVEIIFMYGMYIGFLETTNSTEIPLKTYIIGIAIALIVGVVIVGFFWLFYQLLYGILLKRLKKNHKELEELEM